MTLAHHAAIAKLGASALVAALVFQPLAAFAATITPTLAQVPIQGVNPVKHNVMFTLDDSGSMSWDYLPDWVTWNSASPHPNYCRDSR